MSTDFTEKQSGRYSMDDAECLALEGTVETQPGSNEISVAVSSR